MQTFLDSIESDLGGLDLSLEPSIMLVLLKDVRKNWVVDYNRLKIHAHLNDLVENTALAEQQRESMKKMALQVIELDHQIAAAEKPLEGSNHA